VAWTIQYTDNAVRAIRRLDPQVQRRVRAALETMEKDPLRGKPLQFALKGMRSWRTGDFRIVYRLFEERVEILVITVGHRREVYERLRDRLGK
jgi:mRNA interferase RelE/StbE